MTSIFHSDEGIRMCKYKKVREDLGTMNYVQKKVKIPNVKLGYDEIHAMIKKEKKEKEKLKKGQKSKRKIRFAKENESMNHHVKDIIHKIKMDNKQEFSEEEEIEIEKEKKLDQIEKNQRLNKEKDDDKEDDKRDDKKDDKEDDKKDDKGDDKKDDKDNDKEEQEGGSMNPLKKMIFVTNLSVEKDKEMFQM